MRTSTMVLAALLASLPASQPSSAQTFITYPYCLFSGGDESAVTSCSYVSWQQCQQSRMGEGGICYANPAYKPTAQQPPRRPAR